MRCCPANGYSDDIKRHLQAAPKLFDNPATSLSATLSHLESGRHTPPVQRRSSPAKAHPLAVTSFAKTAFIASDSKPNHLVLFANLPITRAAARQVINPTLAVADHLFTGYCACGALAAPCPLATRIQGQGLAPFKRGPPSARYYALSAHLEPSHQTLLLLCQSSKLTAGDCGLLSASTDLNYQRIDFIHVSVNFLGYLTLLLCG